MRDIASWLTAAATVSGREARLVVGDELPRADGTINLVVAPHEFFHLSDRSKPDLQRAAAASICVCTEQPGTPWFHLTIDACRRGLLSLDISDQGTTELRDAGIAAERLRLGAVPSLAADAATIAPSSRSLDVVFLGGLDDRRAAALAALAPRLYRRRCELRVFTFQRPVGPATPGLVFGAQKYALLSSAKVLVNVHRDRSAHLPPGAEHTPYFEWARMIEAMANGCVVLTEASTGHEPLGAGVHFIEAEVADMPDALDELLRDEERLDEVASAARTAVATDLALDAELGRHLDRIERHVLPHIADHVRAGACNRAVWRLGQSRITAPVRLGPFRPFRAIQEEAKRIVLGEADVMRRLDHVACLLHHGAMQHIERVQTPAYDRASPDVTVLVTLYDYAELVTETLDSIIASEDARFEVVIVEDHSHDGSRAVATQFLREHPEVPMLLLGKDANEGLASARNTGFGAARAPLVMVMDADNLVYPTCLARLARALDDDPRASAAYAILEEFGEKCGVRSAFEWDVERLCDANYIDAQAMVRVDAWRELGGYRDDDRHVFGWEDWDLWLRLAAAGGHAVLVPEMLGRYRVQRSSMISLTNLGALEATDALRLRYPSLPWPRRM
jgi:hypothetical protein